MIDINVENGVADITLPDCRPLSLHDLGMGAALRDLLRDTADNDEVKAIVIRVQGANFCPAVPLAALASAAQARKAGIWSAWHEVFAASYGLYQTLAFCKKIVITVVRGECAGAGSLLVLCSDLTVASEDTRFESPFGCLPEANLVLAALTMRLNRAKSWLLGGTALTAQEAFDAGLVNRVAAADALEAQARKMARAVTRMPLDGIAMSKINVETCLDAQGVGREFDMAGFYAVSMRAYWDSVSRSAEAAK
jgi:enoyl-CoA hydratase/carnithine racemase